MARDQDLEKVLQRPSQEDDLGVREYLNVFRDALIAGDRETAPRGDLARSRGRQLNDRGARRRKFLVRNAYQATGTLPIGAGLAAARSRGVITMRTLIAIAALIAVAACQQETKVEDAADTAEVTTPAPVAPPPATTVTITEADARARIESQGYTNVTGLTQNPDGSWTATGAREGRTTQLSVGPGGVSVVTTTPTTP